MKIWEGTMKLLATVTAVLFSTAALAQQSNEQGQTTYNTDNNLMHFRQLPTQMAPDFGYVVYDGEGKAVKAYGPDTPVKALNDGKIQILGSDLKPGWSVKTEDAPSYIDALASVAAAKSPTEDSDYAKGIRELVVSINDGAATVKDTLCDNPARPSTIKVEIAGGFSFGIHGSMTSTVDWDLDKICPVDVVKTP